MCTYIIEHGAFRYAEVNSSMLHLCLEVFANYCELLLFEQKVNKAKQMQRQKINMIKHMSLNAKKNMRSIWNTLFTLSNNIQMQCIFLLLLANPFYTHVEMLKQ